MAANASAASEATIDRFARLKAQDLRVASVAYRLSVANAGLCKVALAPQSGLVIHSIEQYHLADRAAAARSYALGDGIAVMAVVTGSPADRAGLVAGDALQTVNGRAFPAPVPGAEGRMRTGVALAMLAEEMQRGTVTLGVSGPRGARELVVKVASGCPAAVELISGSGANAWADGDRIMIGEELLRNCASDDDLALVIAHEMAHNLLHHHHRLAAGERATGLLPSAGAGSMAMREFEEEADEMAVRLGRAAGYDFSGAEAFLGGLLQRRAAGETHPEPARRLALLRAAVAAGN